MFVYTTGQWVLLFFFYCFCGWVWESCYVSLCQRRWVNRGFLQGPLLPIYGSGAVIILLATIPVAGNLWLVWLFGMVAATVLEYATGAAMERIFKVRYWDYSSQPFNLNGHICLTSSIAWGFFSILMVRVIHPPVSDLLGRVPAWLVDPAAHGLAVLFTVDAVRSVQAALDLRDVLARLTEENEEFRRVARRIEVRAAFAEDDLRRFRARTELDALLLREWAAGEMEERREAKAERRALRRERVEARLRRSTGVKLEALQACAGALEACRDRLASLPGMEDPAALEKAQAELDALARSLRKREDALRTQTPAVYHRSLRILRGNPSAMTRDFAEALESLRRLGERK